MNLLVFGASGQCGHWIVRLAAARGDRVTAFVRPSTAFDAPAGVTVVRGEVLDERAVAAAMPGHDAVLSCLGSQRANAANPFSPLTSPPNFAERSARIVAASAAGAGVRRLAAISAAGVGDSASRMPWLMRWLLGHSTLGPIYADLAAMEMVYAESGLDWCAVRPVTLVNAAPSSRARQVERYRLVSMIGRADVARYMLAALDAPPPFAWRRPLIGWW